MKATQPSKPYPFLPDWTPSSLIQALDPWLAKDAALVLRLFRPELRHAWREIEKRMDPAKALFAIFAAHYRAHACHRSRQEDIDRYRAIATTAGSLAKLLQGTDLEWTPFKFRIDGLGHITSGNHEFNLQIDPVLLFRQIFATLGRPDLYDDGDTNPQTLHQGIGKKRATEIEIQRRIESALQLAMLPRHSEPEPPPVHLPALLAILVHEAGRQADKAKTAPRLVPSPGRQEAGRLAFLRSLGSDFKHATGSILKGTLAKIAAAALEMEIDENDVRNAFAGYKAPPPEPNPPFPWPELLPATR
jgi:hypothetical protein